MKPLQLCYTYQVDGFFYISPNKIKIWQECPRKYWHYYLNEPTKYQEPKRPYFTLGTAVHDTLNSFFTLVPQIRSKERLFDIFEKHWMVAKNQEGGFKNPEEEKAYKDRAFQMLENFYAKEDVAAVPFKLSPRYNPYIEISETVKLGGIIDRVDLEEDGSLHIIDYKTGKEDRDDPLQLPIYAVLVRGWLKKEAKKLSYLHLESGNWSTSLSMLDLENETKREVLRIAEEIPKEGDKDFFRCHLGPDCNHCDYLLEINIKPILN